jgi:tRNA nucleotidyltransferase/poly(A) polymerase
VKEFYLEVAAAGGQTFHTGPSLRNSLLGLPYYWTHLAVVGLSRAQVVHILEKLEQEIISEDATHIVTANNGLAITLVQNIQELSEQTDFTIHSIYHDTLTGAVFDPFHGALDLKNKIIRAPRRVFLGSPIKMVEACRLVGELGFTLNVETWFELYNNAQVVKHVNPDILRKELSTILMLPAPSVVFKQLQEARLLEYIIPELARCPAIIQSKRSGVKDVFEHIMYALDACERRLDLRLVILFHDIAKPQTLHCDPNGTIHFFKHEIYGSKIAKEYLKYWNFPKEIVHKVSHLILHHMFDADPGMVDKTVKRLIRKVGREHIFDLLKVREADRGGTSVKPSMRKIKNLRKKIERLLSDDTDLTLGAVPNTGDNITPVHEAPREIQQSIKPKKVIGDKAGPDIGTDGSVSD